MERRDFLKTTGAAIGAALFPLPALAAPVPNEFGDKVFRIHTMPSGWTKGPHEDHYTQQAVIKAWRLTATKLEKHGRLPVWDNYDTSKAAIGWLIDLKVGETREVQPVTHPLTGYVQELVPGRSVVYLEATVRSHIDLTGLHIGPAVMMDTRDGGPYVIEDTMSDVTDWSVFDETKFQGVDLAAWRFA